MKIRVLHIDIIVENQRSLKLAISTLVGFGPIKWEVWTDDVGNGLCENGETLPEVIRGFCQTLDEVYQRKVDASELLASLADELEKMAVETRGKVRP